MNTITKNDVRVFWKCTAKGCKSFAVTDLADGKLHGEIDGPWDTIHEIWCSVFYMGDAKRREATKNLYRSYGALCTEHDQPMKGALLAGTYNPDKACDGRCTHAKRASCDCSCRGANHGRNHI